MNGPALVADALDRVSEILHRDLKDMTPQELVAGTKPHIG